MLAWFGGTDKGSKVGRALIAGGWDRPARTERLRLEAGLELLPRPRSGSSLSKLLRSAAGQTCPFSRVIARLTLPDIQLHLWIGFRKVTTRREKYRKKKPFNELPDTFIRIRL